MATTPPDNDAAAVAAGDAATPSIGSDTATAPPNTPPSTSPGATPGTHVRNAGPDAMVGDEPDWDPVDQAMDESFPASDPPPATPGVD